MIEKLASRLDALATVSAAVRAKIQGRDAGQLDGLAVARLLVAVDSAVTRLANLAGALQPALFPAPSDNGEDGDAGREPRRQRASAARGGRGAV